MAEETTIIEIEFGNSLKNIQELNREIERLKREQKELKDQGKENSQTFIQNASDIRVLTSEVRENTKVIDNVNKSYQAGAGSIKQLRAELSIAKKAYSELSAEERANVNIGGQLLKQASSLNQELKELEGAYGDNQRSVGGYKDAIEGSVITIDSLKNKLKDLQQTIQTTAIDSDEFRAASEEAGKLGLQIGQLEGKLNEFGNREPKNPAKKAFDDAVISAVTLGSTVKLLSDTFVESEDSQKALAKAVQGFAIAQTVANIVKEKGAIIDTATLITTKAQTIASALAAKVTGVLTGATRLFGLTATQAWAAATLGLSVLITAIVALIANIDTVIASIKSFFGITEDNSKAIAESFKRGREELEGQVKALQQVSKQTEKNFTRQIRLAEAAGKDATNIRKQQFEATQRFINAEIALLEKRIALEAQGLNETAAREAFRQRAELQERLTDLVVDFQVKGLEAERKILEEAKKTAEERAKLRQEQEIKRVSDLTKEAADLTAAEKARIESEKRITEAIITESGKRATAENVALEAQLQANERKREALALIQQGITEDAQAAFLALDANTLQSFATLTEQFQLNQQALFEQYQQQLEVNGDLTLEKFIEQQAFLLQNEREIYLQRAALAQQFAVQVGDLLADAITDSEASLEDFSRGLTLLILDTLEKQIQAAIAGAIAQEIGTKGVAGIVTGAIAAAAVRTAFAAAKNQISRPPKGFATGVVGLNGPGTETSDSIPAWLSKGESVITASGTDWFQQNYPGLLEFANSNHKFATGVVDFNPEPSVSGELSIIDAIRALPNPVVRVSDIDKGFNDVRSVQVTGQIG